MSCALQWVEPIQPFPLHLSHISTFLENLNLLSKIQNRAPHFRSTSELNPKIAKVFFFYLGPTKHLESLRKRTHWAIFPLIKSTCTHQISSQVLDASLAFLQLVIGVRAGGGRGCSPHSCENYVVFRAGFWHFPKNCCQIPYPRAKMWGQIYWNSPPQCCFDTRNQRLLLKMYVEYIRNVKS